MLLDLYGGKVVTQSALWQARWLCPASRHVTHSPATEIRGWRLETILATSRATFIPQIALKPHRSRRASYRSGATQTSLAAQRCSNESTSNVLFQHRESPWWASAGLGECSRDNEGNLYLGQHPRLTRSQQVTAGHRALLPHRRALP